MKLSKNLGRIATTFLATAMLASVSAVPAFAAGVTTSEGQTADTDISSVTITKKVETDGNTYAPNTTFTFNVALGSGKTFNDGTGNVTAESGVEGGLKAGSGATFAPVTSNDEGEYVAPAAEYTATETLTVDDSVFQEPGIYHYIVTENNTTYEGVTKDSSTYDVYLYVYNTDNYTDLYVGHVVAVKNGEADTKADLLFTNDYGKTTDTTHNVVITKNVEGSFADMSDTFTFTVGVNGSNTGEAYKVVYTNGETTKETSVTSGGTITVEGIKDDDTITIYGLTENDTYTVTETNGVSQGYTVTDSDGESNGNGTVSGKVSSDNTSATITNTKNATPPTGLVMNIAPYALLVVVAAGACFVFLRKRRED